ncbi:MAG: hypothetical protein NC253_13260 [Ruminococcus sp.]|nr:hypothetical protein [Ruminococcus sp.]MCM1480473.1 hypothetical protein [Muribaculaceae bacterium]
MTYINMLMEYKRSENALRERIGQINAAIHAAEASMEVDLLRRRKTLLEGELYDLLDVIGDIRDYAGCGVNEQCKNA